ncbi:MAG: patatin-like phospholipase family protein [Holophagales bacterium]|nr:patatin-like phospholipase family protein [Holophagales bacterium]
MPSAGRWTSSTRPRAAPGSARRPDSEAPPPFRINWRRASRPAPFPFRRSSDHTQAEARSPHGSAVRAHGRSVRGLVCAGGGVTGAIYEIGVLAALEERLDGFSLTECDVFVGVSAGAYVGTLVASGVSPSVLFQNATHPRSSTSTSSPSSARTSGRSPRASSRPR